MRLEGREATHPLRPGGWRLARDGGGREVRLGIARDVRIGAVLVALEHGCGPLGTRQTGVPRGDRTTQAAKGRNRQFIPQNRQLMRRNGSSALADTVWERVYLRSPGVPPGPMRRY